MTKFANDKTLDPKIGLHEFPLWVNMQRWEMDELIRVVQIRGYSAGEMLFNPLDSPERLYLLQHGRVKTYTLSPEGQAKVMHVFCPGDAFGGLLMGAVDGLLPYAEAVDDVVVCMVDEVGFKSLMQRCPNTCFGLFRYMAKHHTEDMRRIEQLLHSRAQNRVLYALLTLGERLGNEFAPEFSIYPYFTHEDIANMVGLRRTTVSEMISQLRREGVIIGTGRRFLINRAAAEQYLEQNQ